MSAEISGSETLRFELRYQLLEAPSRTFAFPCDACGNVDMNQLSDACRCDYLFARIMTRLENAQPEVVPRIEH